jgi:hypothetical protein
LTRSEDLPEQAKSWWFQLVLLQGQAQAAAPALVQTIMGLAEFVVVVAAARVIVLLQAVGRKLAVVVVGPLETQRTRQLRQQVETAWLSWKG